MANRAHRLIWLWATVALLAPGLLVGVCTIGLFGLAVASVCAGPIGGLVALLFPTAMGGGRPRPLVGGAAAVAVVVATIGLSRIVGDTTDALLLILLTAAAAYALRGRMQHRPKRRRRLRRRRSRVPSDDELPQLSEARSIDDCVSTVDLCRMWRSSHTALQRTSDPGITSRIVLARQYCLDELERRDRAGFERWLRSGARAAGDPGRYLTADVSGLGSDR